MIILSYLMIICSGCAISLPTFKPYDFHKEIQNKTFEKKLDQLIIILDASISMTETYMGQEKFKSAILALHHINAALSAIRIPIGFHVLGTGACHFCERAQPLFHISPYQASRLDISQLKKINPGGETPLHNAIDSANNDFYACTGKMGLIIISDFNMNDDSIKNAFQPIINTYGNRLSICCLSVGTPKRAVELSRTLSSLQNNIQCLHAEQILSYNELKNFIQIFFLQPVYDHDLDNIPDKKDHCKNTPSGAWVDDLGCPKDSDNDGILDGLDRCKDTYKGAPVDENGCWSLPVLFYAQNQFYMTREQEKSLLPFVKLLEENHICVEIQGHADNSGSKQGRIDVSYKRAQSVMAYLLTLGLRHYQLKIKGLGASIPMDHRHAMIKNASQRRVTFEVIECPK